MENTYTYTARNAEDPAQVMTVTLLDHHMSVGLGPPLEQVEAALETEIAGDEAQPEESQSAPSNLWLKPVVVSLVERGVGPFQLADVDAAIRDDWLRVSAWYRAGLALAPITLVDGRVDNPPAAQAFVHELEARKAELERATGLFRLLDLWLTWILAVAVVLGLWQVWRRRTRA